MVYCDGKPIERVVFCLNILFISSLIISYMLFVFICQFIDSFSFIGVETASTDILIETGNVSATEVKVAIPITYS